MFACQNFTGQIALFLRFTPRSNKVMAITITDAGTRSVQLFSPDSFKKEWIPFSYPVAKLASRWLVSSGYIPLSQNARKELQMIISIFNNAEGKTDVKVAADMSTPLTAGAIGYFDSAEALAAGNTGKDMLAIIEAVTGSARAKCKDKGKMAEAIWAACEEQLKKCPPPAAPPTSTTGEKPKTEKPAGDKRPSVKNQLRTLFATKDVCYNLDKLVELTGGTVGSITTAISDLKNAKYAGGDVMSIVKSKEEGKEGYVLA